MSSELNSKNQNIWEQLDNESDEDYEMFVIYRSLSPNERNTIKMWETYSERNNLSKKMPTKIDKLAEKFQWYDRSIAFDSYYEGALVTYATKDQFRDILAYRKKQRDLANRLTEVSLGLIKLAQNRLLSLKPEELSVSLLPKYIQTAVMITGMAMESEASALMLQEMAELMQNGLNFSKETSDEEEDLSLWESDNNG